MSLPESLPAHRIALARELLDDIELSRLPPESLLLKATRLAQVMDATVVEEWLTCELRGYPKELSLEIQPYVGLTGRWGNIQTQTFYFQPYAALLGNIRAMETELQSLKVPDVNFAPHSSNPNE